MSQAQESIVAAVEIREKTRHPNRKNLPQHISHQSRGAIEGTISARVFSSDPDEMNGVKLRGLPEMIRRVGGGAKGPFPPRRPPTSDL